MLRLYVSVFFGSKHSQEAIYRFCGLIALGLGMEGAHNLFVKIQYITWMSAFSRYPVYRQWQRT